MQGIWSAVCFRKEPSKKRMKQFSIIGLSGYISPRHVKAIKETHNNLRAATDPHDNVGFIDATFPEASFF